MEHPICKHCGSDDVGVEATAHWDNDKQAWRLSDVSENEYCNACGDDTILVWVKKEDEENEAGQDRESYSDTQDSESYTTEED